MAGLQAGRILKQIAFEMLTIPTVQEKMKALAHQSANELTATLLPHLHDVVKKGSGNPGGLPELVPRLEDIFLQALDLISEMETSFDFKYRIVWFESRTTIDERSMKTIFSRSDHKEVAIAFIPYVSAQRPGAALDMVSAAEVIAV